MKQSDSHENCRVVDLETARRCKHCANLSCQHHLQMLEGRGIVQEGEAAKLMKDWRGSAAVWLSFGTNSFSDRFTPARSSFDTIFAYEPVAAKAGHPLL